MKLNKGFPIYFDWIERLKDIEPDRAFAIICALSDYFKDGVNPLERFVSAEKALVGIMFDQIKRAEHISAVNSENGLKSAQSRSKSFNDRSTNKKSVNRSLNYNNNNNNSNIIKEEIYKEESTKKTRHKYGQYNNVLLSDEELEKLKSEFPDDWQARIERVSEYVASTGKSYKNFLAVIRTWARNEKNVLQQQSSKKESETEVPKYSNFKAEEALDAAIARSYTPITETQDSLFEDALKRTYGG